MRTCDGCRWCCWAYAVPETDSPARTACRHECAAGCSVHETDQQPRQCREFRCPYLHGDPIYRPDTFMEAIRAAGGTLRSMIPWVPLTVPMAPVIDLIQRTRSLACALKTPDWTLHVMALDQAGTIWSATPEQQQAWRSLYGS